MIPVPKGEVDYLVNPHAGLSISDERGCTNKTWELGSIDECKVQREATPRRTINIDSKKKKKKKTWECHSIYLESCDARISPPPRSCEVNIQMRCHSDRQGKTLNTSVAILPVQNAIREIFKNLSYIL